jgi:hypothetical protein
MAGECWKRPGLFPPGHGAACFVRDGGGPGGHPGLSVARCRFATEGFCPISVKAPATMTPEQAWQQVRQLQDDLLVAEAAQVAEGWRFLTVDGITAESEQDLHLYEQVLFAFDEAASGHESRYASTSSQLTLGIRGQDAGQRIAELRCRVAALNPPGFWSGQRWQIRDGAR